jgi:hypothetical protein
MSLHRAAVSTGLVAAHLLALPVTGCKRFEAQPAPPEAASGSPRAYVRAPVRLVPWAERDAVVLWVSHILISHSQAQSDMVLRPAGWGPDDPVKRSPSDAASLAERIGSEARAHPDRFEALAREHSDDGVTRTSGGSLGGIRATQLPDEFLDALTVLHPGEVSDVVTTSQGFHILLLRAPPPRETVAGLRIVLRYVGVPFVEGKPPTRSHEEARTLAQQLIQRAKAGMSFADLVDQYSEHRDRILHGELGSWSTTAPAYNAREIETLRSIEVGAIAEPMDSVFGYQVLERVEVPPPRPYAMAAIRIKYSPAVPPEDPHSRPSVERDTRGLARRFHEAPMEFVRSHEKYGAPEVETWEFGHGEPELTLALDKLKVAEVAASPVEIPAYYVVPMRLDPALVARAEPPLRYELPQRATPDLEEVFRNAETTRLLSYVAELRRPEVVGQMGLDSDTQDELRSALDELEKRLTASRDGTERANAYINTQKQLYSGLPAATYATVMGLIQAWAARVMLSPR